MARSDEVSSVHLQPISQDVGNAHQNCDGISAVFKKTRIDTRSRSSEDVVPPPTQLLLRLLDRLQRRGGSKRAYFLAGMDCRSPFLPRHTRASARIEGERGCRSHFSKFSIDLSRSPTARLPSLQQQQYVVLTCCRHASILTPVDTRQHPGNKGLE